MATRWHAGSSSSKWVDAPSSSRWKAAPSSTRWVAHSSAGRWSNKFKGGKGLTFWAPLNAQSISDVPTNITVGATEVAPTLFYVGSDADASEWSGVAGPTLAKATNGSSIAFQVDQPTPLVTTADRCVLFRGDGGFNGDYYESPDTTSGDIPQTDFVLSWLADIRSIDSISACASFGKGGSLAAQSWHVGARSANQEWNMVLRDGTTQWDWYDTGLNMGLWKMYTLCVNISEASATNGARFYRNGEFYYAQDMSSWQGVSNSLEFCIGWNNDTGTRLCNSRVAFLGLWDQADLFSAGATGATEMDTLAESMWCSMSGTIPTTSKGSSTITYARNSNATLEHVTDSGNFQRFEVGPNWPRIASRDSDDASGVQAGYQVERQATNLVTHSDRLDNASWDKDNSSITITGVESPDSLTYYYQQVTEDATAAAEHGISQDHTLTNGKIYTLSAHIKPLNRDWAYLEIAGAGNTASAYYNLATGAMGATSGILDAGFDNGIYNSGHYRVYLSFTDGTGGTAKIKINAADSDGGKSYLGLSQTSIRVWGVQLESDVSAPTTLIMTDGSTAARPGDVMSFAAADNVGTTKHTITAEIISKDKDLEDDSVVVSINKAAGPTADRVSMRIDATGDVLVAQTDATAGDSGTSTGTTDIVDGSTYALKVTAKENSVKGYVDGSQEGSTDAAADMPSGLDTIEIGCENSLLQPNCLIANVKLFKK